MTEHASPSAQSGLAFIFPGQASQRVGMGVELRQASSRADLLFEQAERITGLPIGNLCASGPLEELTRTDVAQIAVVTTSLAAAYVLEDMLERPIPAMATAGHSVGELAAMCFAGALTAEETLALVHERGTLMQRDSAASNGTMVAVLGLSADELEPICRDASSDSDGRVQVANINAPGQVVISGDRTAIARASASAKTAGARRVLPLTVGGPFHSVYMSDAARDFAAAVNRVKVAPARIPIVLNTTTEPETNGAALQSELATQITSPVRWEPSIRRMIEMGCTGIVELGPGDVLTGMNKRIAPDMPALAAESPEALQRVAELIRGGLKA